MMSNKDNQAMNDSDPKIRPDVHVARPMPDVAHGAGTLATGALDWVGMGEIALPIRIAASAVEFVQTPARVAVFVNLQQPQARGIHMSRLYLLLDRELASAELTPALLQRVLGEFVASQRELSSRAMLRIAFDCLLRRPALVSANSGWKAYPVVVTAVLDERGFALETAFEVKYSSTCPSSAALARQLIQEQFKADFADAALQFDRVLDWLGSEQGIHATPHAQRSGAEVGVRMRGDVSTFPLLALIDQVEGALKTPVQTAVKREDEQAFARLNGANLMFCEDAARRIKQALDRDDRITDFWLRASHYESLHAHNAVAVATKGVAGGYAALSKL